jgi:hypothetical protein
MFAARYALSPYIKQIRFVFKGLKAFLKADVRMFFLRTVYLKRHGAGTVGSTYFTDCYMPSTNSEVGSDLGFIFVLSIETGTLISQHGTAGLNLDKKHLQVLLKYGYSELKEILCGDGFTDFIHRPKSKILKS